ncbi:MAG: ankyrin repeat domain-containing protein [Rickettsiaceae bacterium]|nr:ankyrin repeat domain-containing protein [Rickettsiaceae bacterium]
MKEGKDNYAINAIISKGADVNHVSKINGLTPLTYAVSIGDADMTKNLLQNGAKIDLEDNFGCTPLQMVEDIAKSNPDIIRIFAEYCTPENEKCPPNTKTRSRGKSV